MFKEDEMSEPVIPERKIPKHDPSTCKIESCARCYVIRQGMPCGSYLGDIY